MHKLEKKKRRETRNNPPKETGIQFLVTFIKKGSTSQGKSQDGIDGYTDGGFCNFVLTRRLNCGLNNVLCGLLDRPVDFKTKLFTAFYSHLLICFCDVKRTKQVFLSIYLGLFQTE